MAGNKVRIVNNLPAFVDATQKRGLVAMNQALVRIGSEVAALVPRDTSTLINSQYRDSGIVDGQVRGRIGFTAEYAAAVHEASGTLKGQQRPKRDGKDRGAFWGPGDGQPQFMEVAAERAESDVARILGRGVKA